MCRSWTVAEFDAFWVTIPWPIVGEQVREIESSFMMRLAQGI